MEINKLLVSKEKLVSKLSREQIFGFGDNASNTVDAYTFKLNINNFEISDINFFTINNTIINKTPYSNSQYSNVEIKKNKIEDDNIEFFDRLKIKMQCTSIGISGVEMSYDYNYPTYMNTLYIHSNSDMVYTNFDSEIVDCCAFIIKVDNYEIPLIIACAHDSEVENILDDYLTTCTLQYTNLSKDAKYTISYPYTPNLSTLKERLDLELGNTVDFYSNESEFFDESDHTDLKFYYNSDFKYGAMYADHDLVGEDKVATQERECMIFVYTGDNDKFDQHKESFKNLEENFYDIYDRKTKFEDEYIHIIARLVYDPSTLQCRIHRYRDILESDIDSIQDRKFEFSIDYNMDTGDINSMSYSYDENTINYECQCTESKIGAGSKVFTIVQHNSLTDETSAMMYSSEINSSDNIFGSYQDEYVKLGFSESITKPLSFTSFIYDPNKFFIRGPLMIPSKVNSVKIK